MIDEKHEARDGMRIDWDAPIRMDDGVVLRADVFRPIAEGVNAGDKGSHVAEAKGATRWLGFRE